MRTQGLPRPAKPGEMVAIDIEIFKQEKPLHLPTGTFASMSIGFEDETYMITDEHDIGPALERLSDGLWVLHNSMYDLRHLRRWANIEERDIYDTMIVEQDIFGGYYSDFSLADLARRWLHVVMDKDTVMEFTKRESMTQEMIDYSFQDAEVTLAIAKKQKAWYEAQGLDLNWYWEIDMPAIWSVLAFQPIRVDAEQWLEHAEELKELGYSKQEELGFNVKSYQQCIAELAQVGIEVESTSKDKVLEPLIEKLRESGSNPEGLALIKGIIEAREYRDAYSKYGKRWVEKHVRDGNVLADYKITGASTGRMASSNPNLQNIPVRKMPIFRSFFVARPGNKFLVSDVSQQEPRFTAHLTQDPELIAAIRSGEDLHQTIADMVGIERREAKAINLGLAYGLTEYGLADDLGISKEQAEAYMDRYFNRFRGLAAWIDQTRQEARRKGYVTTASGRLYWINEYNWQWRNNAINSPVQGSAADHTKLMLNILRKRTETLGLPYLVTNVVHDEVTADVPEGLVDQYVELIEDAWVESGARLAPEIPMKVDTKIGDNWGVKT